MLREKLTYKSSFLLATVPHNALCDVWRCYTATHRCSHTENGTVGRVLTHLCQQWCQRGVNTVNTCCQRGVNTGCVNSVLTSTRRLCPWVAVRAAPKRARPTSPLTLARRVHCRACRCRWLLCHLALFWRVCLLRRSNDGCCGRVRVCTIVGRSVCSMLRATCFVGGQLVPCLHGAANVPS